MNAKSGKKMSGKKEMICKICRQKDLRNVRSCWRSRWIHEAERTLDGPPVHQEVDKHS